MTIRVKPTTKGTDLTSTNGEFDAHVRLETIKGERYVTVDIFRSKVKNANKAHLESEAFRDSVAGRSDATAFLKDFGFDAIVLAKVAR